VGAFQPAALFARAQDEKAIEKSRFAAANAKAASCNDGQFANCQMDGQMNAQMDSQMDSQMNSKMNAQIDYWLVNRGQIESSAVESAEPDTETRAKTL